MNENQDQLKRAYASLLALRTNISAGDARSTVEPETAKIYTDQLDKLESIGIDIVEYRIPVEMLRPEMIEVDYETHETAPSGNIELKLGHLRTKLDGLLTYFELTAPSSEPTEIGFRA